MAASASAATVTRYGTRLRCARPTMLCIHLVYYYYYYYRTYVGDCVAPFFFFYGVRCAQYKVHAQCSFAALAPHMPCMLLVRIPAHCECENIRYETFLKYGTYAYGTRQKKVSGLSQYLPVLPQYFGRYFRGYFCWYLLYSTIEAHNTCEEVFTSSEQLYIHNSPAVL